MADKGLPERKVFLVSHDNPDDRTFLKPGWVTDKHVNLVKTLQAHWQCVCGQRDMQFQRGTMVDGKKRRAPYFSSKPDTLLSHDPACAFRRAADAKPSARKFDSARFKDCIRDGYAVVINLNTKNAGVNYRRQWLATNHIPDPSLPHAATLAQFCGQYLAISLTDGNALPALLDQVVGISHHLDRVWLAHGDSIIPVKAAFHAPNAGQWAYQNELIAVHDALQKRMTQADTKRERESVSSFPLFPRLEPLVPSVAQMKDLLNGEMNGQMAKIGLPALRGHGYVSASGEGEARKNYLFSHSIIFPDAETRRAAVAALRARTPLYMIGVPEVSATSLKLVAPEGQRAQAYFDTQRRVLPGMVIHKPFTEQVMQALAAPKRDMFRDPALTQRDICFSPAA